ncbi:gliding motility-associated C-terminal domain-containing protein [Flavobacterium sp. MR2016-29]|uniref:HYR-like domain-containing protein n=1 Tax=Flavobacterium sp. MR2016-29 TaxID=2783795 RepID=UPI00188A1486|nr:gliding motility-associated C-terminal domain-containing protein [Flavobacterium sp. MR2016-29]MBF4493078.1 gliding motility-associated C-terminal domain-containing protein [Flavobacterium sp. MR2016-29]
MEKLLLSFRTNLLDIKKIYFPVLFILSSSFGFAQNVTTNKTVSANPENCGIVNVKIDITGSDPTTRNSDVILAIDISGSMGNTISGDLKTSMDYAKSAAIAFIDQAKINPQNRIAIVAYSTTASLKIGLTYLNAAGVTAVKNQINSLQATNSTNINAGILKSETELETNGRFDCSTARSIILLTDGVTNKTGVNGSTDCNVSKTSQCVTDAINASTNAKTTTKSSVVYNNQVFAVGLFGGISGNINTEGSDRNVAKYTLDQIQGSAAYITNSGANLTSIYNQIASQLSWVAQTLVQQETVIAGFTISDITTTKGTASASGQVITWNTDFLNSETITLNYQLTPTGSVCGTQNVSSSTFNYKNSSCANDSKTITTPTYFVPCIPTITGVLTACGSTTLTANTNASSPTYVWYKDNIVLNGETKSTLAVTSSGVYKVKVKNGSTNCELTSAASTLTISPAAALIAPGNETVSGCDTSAITSLPYKTIDTAITLAQLTNAGGSILNSANIGNYTLTYSDVSTGTCPTIVTRTFKVVTSCGTITKSQTITIQDTTAPAWTTAATALNVNLQCGDLAGLIIEQAKAPLATDNCTGTVTYNKTSGAFTASVSCSNAGTYTNTWIAKDICNNTSETFTQVITIQDTTAPTWITQTASLNKTIECSDQSALASAQALFPVASDLCDNDVSNIVKITGSFVPSAGCSNAGTYTNTWTVKDDCGNTSKTFTQVITIQDTMAPTWITQNASLNKTIECSDQTALASAQALFPVASDLCDNDVSNIVKITGSFVPSAGCSNAGTYTNTWTVKDDCGNTSQTFTQVITIQDTMAPTWITQTASLNKTIECSDQTALASAQALFPVASDLCDNDVSNIVKMSGSFVPSAGCSNAGTYTNTWTVKDDCGNTSETFTQVITIQDTTAPIFAGDLPTDITVSCDAVPKAADVEASDNCNGSLPIVFSETKNNIQNTCATNYTLTRKWSTSDCAGNQATYTQIITVKDSIAPTGTAPADIAGLQNITDIPAANPQEITNARDNCSGDVKITVSDSDNGASGCEGNAYILTRTYTLTDCAGNKTDLVQTFTVENKVAVSGVAVNTTCFGGKDGSILVTNSLGSTVVITNENNEVVGNSNLPAGTYTLTAAAVNSNQTCTATASVTIKQPTYTVKIFGHVINGDKNMPLANVPVTLIPQGTTPGSTQIRITNIDGLYSFSGMSKGNYLLQVQDANLNSAYQLYPVDSSLFFTALEDCVIQEHDFKYGKSDLPVLGDYVWYDTNGNGLQDEWYDANNDGIVTKNIPDSEGAIDYSKWEWLDLNGDGSFAGPLNAGELNAGGFGNANSSNIIIDGPNGYHDEVIIGIQGFWRNRPESANPFGDYNIKLVRDGNLNAVAAALGATGLVKVLPSNTAKKITSKTNKSQLHTVCQTTTNAELIVTVTPEDLVHLDADFGVNCREYLDIVANDDTAGPIAGVNHITTNVLNVLPNDTLEGVVVKASDVIITTVTPNAFLQLNPDGSVDVLPNAPVGNLTLVYQICEADQTSNCDTATVSITIEAPVMTVTATPICVNDVPYVDYAIIPGNFIPINGVTIVWADNNNNIITTMTNLPLSGRILWPGAVVDQAGNGIDWPGWLFQNNKWIQGADGFETLRATAKLTISVNPSETIIVNYPPADPYCIARPTFAIVANDDTAGPINGVSGGTNVVNVYTNDTLNNLPINPNDVTLTTVTPDPTGTLALNPDGSVNVAPNTPAGTYILTYQICENANFGNCDTATVTIIVSSGAIIANDDSYNNIGCNTFGLVGNVLTNDLLYQAPATLQVVNFTLATANNTAVKTDPNITIDTSGNINVGSLTPAGTYTYTYQICEKLNPSNCDSGLVTVTVLPIGVTTISSQACADDSTLVDLRALLPANTPATGTWIDTSNTNALNGNTLNPFGLALGNYVFEYKITDQSCPRSIVVNMEINDDCQVLACGNVVIHNAFSPNGDGINDIFKIDSIDDIACYPENTVEIYNRWGILVFETSNYNNTTNVFDGTSRGRTTVKESDGLPTGTYFYIVTYKSLDGNNAIQNNKKDGYLYLSK